MALVSFFLFISKGHKGAQAVFGIMKGYGVRSFRTKSLGHHHARDLKESHFGVHVIKLRIKF